MRELIPARPSLRPARLVPVLVLVAVVLALGTLVLASLLPFLLPAGPVIAALAGPLTLLAVMAVQGRGTSVCADGDLLRTRGRELLPSEVTGTALRLSGSGLTSSLQMRLRTASDEATIWLAAAGREPINAEARDALDRFLTRVPPRPVNPDDPGELDREQQATADTLSATGRWQELSADSARLILSRFDDDAAPTRAGPAGPPEAASPTSATSGSLAEEHVRRLWEEDDRAARAHL